MSNVILLSFQSSAAVVLEKAEVEAAKGAVEGQAGRLTQEAERLRRRTQELENEVAKLNRIIDEAKLQESRLGDRVGRLEVRFFLFFCVCVWAVALPEQTATECFQWHQRHSQCRKKRLISDWSHYLYSTNSKANEESLIIHLKFCHITPPKLYSRF